MDDYSSTEGVYRASLSRARDLCELQEYLTKTYSPALDTTDMLRAAVVLGVSAFDYLVHELFRIEVLVRHRDRRLIERLHIPFNVGVSDSAIRENLIDNYVRETNSYKSFVDPGKFSEAMGCFVQAPWLRISEHLGEQEKPLKKRLRTIYRWRNRIAHEADINPVLAGVELWPIEKFDVLDAINDLERIGLATIAVLRKEQF